MVRYRRWRAAPFPLTPTLSLREREQRASRSEKPTGLDCSPRREGFTLSPRERAGVRGKQARDDAARMSSPWRTGNARSVIWLRAIHSFTPPALPEVADFCCGLMIVGLCKEIRQPALSVSQTLAVGAAEHETVGDHVGRAFAGDPLRMAIGESPVPPFGTVV